MFGSKLRSWMEAVRPKKKNHRKEKQTKLKNINGTASNQTQLLKKSNPSPESTRKLESELSSNGPLTQESASSRYSVANLSSPESAYSTGYSTDGTSPCAPSEYYADVEKRLEVRPPNIPCDTNPSIQPTPPIINSPLLNSRTKQQTAVEVASPRQRNRIRTNPWLSSCTNPVAKNWPNNYSSTLSDSRYFVNSNQSVAASPKPRRKSLPSSSCSSLSGAETYWEGSEDDCTLNEMMGKYDESYVYEKETDILSDSEPTDLDTDLDTGQDGGDELEPQEGDIYYIDDGSYTEANFIENKNTGHCSYFNFQEKRKTCRKKTTKRSRHKSVSHKRRGQSNQTAEKIPYLVTKSDGSRSVGATPLFARRTHQLPISKLAIEDKLAKRSNSALLYRDPISYIDRKDEEAELKYEELIVEAEHILRNIKTEGLSPRRLPGPANKRVEFLRSAECPKSTRVGDISTPNIPLHRLLPRHSLPVNGSSNIPIRSPHSTRKPPGESRDRQPHHRSPKSKRKSSKIRREIMTSSSEDERPKLRAPPQSEPVKRKVYASCNRGSIFQSNNCSELPQRHRNSAESLRHQVLINTISNLKKSLENQSASLKQAYRSPVHCSPCL